MKKTLFLLLSCLFLFRVEVYAEEPKPVLKQADIKVTVDKNHHYKVEEKITITNPQSVPDRKLNHTLIQQDKLSDLTFTSNGQELHYEVNRGDVLNKLKVNIPETVKNSFQYTVTYTLNLQEDNFSTPLVVPMYPSSGEESVISIQFSSPEGTYIHKDSFPVLKESVKNEVTNKLINVPSHVNYKYGQEPTSLFNPYNLVSGFIFVLLISVLAVWFIAERKKEHQEVAA